MAVNDRRVAWLAENLNAEQKAVFAEWLNEVLIPYAAALENSK